MHHQTLEEGYTASARSMMAHMVEKILIPRVFKEDVGDRPGYSGSAEVDGKLYALYFRRLNNTTVEVSITRNATVIKWTCTRDMFNECSTQVQQQPGPGACGYAGYLNDPWLHMRIFATYVDNNPLVHY